MSLARACATLLLVAATSACTTPGAPAVATSAPLIGVAGTTDSADRQCHVVLRQAGRVDNGSGGYRSSDSGSYLFDGLIDISAAATAEAALPSVMYQYGSDPTWYEMYGYIDAAEVVLPWLHPALARGLAVRNPALLVLSAQVMSDLHKAPAARAQGPGGLDEYLRWVADGTPPAEEARVTSTYSK